MATCSNRIAHSPNSPARAASFPACGCSTSIRPASSSSPGMYIRCAPVALIQRASLARVSLLSSSTFVTSHTTLFLQLAFARNQPDQAQHHRRVSVLVRRPQPDLPSFHSAAMVLFKSSTHNRTFPPTRTRKYWFRCWLAFGPFVSCKNPASRTDSENSGRRSMTAAPSRVRPPARCRPQSHSTFLPMATAATTWHCGAPAPFAVPFGHQSIFQFVLARARNILPAAIDGSGVPAAGPCDMEIIYHQVPLYLPPHARGKNRAGGSTRLWYTFCCSACA